MASILVMGGFGPAIGILCGGELGGEGVRKGDTGDGLLRGVGNNRGFREKDSELKPTDVSLCAEAVTAARGEAVKLGVGKSSAVVGLRQDTASEEMGVTRISPSNPRPGGKPQQEHSQNSRNGKLQKTVCQETEAERMEFLQRETAITWFGGSSFSFRGLFFTENHLPISSRRS
jgi:hypothetical protein